MSLLKAKRSNGFQPINWDATPKELDDAFGHGSEEQFGNLDEQIRIRQIIVYVMIGGGTLGEMATTRPANALTCNLRRLQYPESEIRQALQVLKYQMELAGYFTGIGSKNKIDIKPLRMHHMGVFS